ncbi:MAG: Gfo/Idh/MocA family oxidoreductase [Oscillospiraceae bacterium]|jgi:predicted dehydrogenase|nr:Gfo/Idh/MocA family oxidoreductase [Oscillospiraceae bacterium]
MIRYAILGTSWIAEEFFRAAQGTELALAAVCSRTEERGRAFAAKLGQPGLPVCLTPEALAADNTIQAVYIASPNVCHAPQSELLLRAGKHVLCEKPVVLHPDDLRRLQTIAKEHGLIFMEAIMFLHTPARRTVIEALPRLGGVTSVCFDFSQRSSRCGALRGGEIHNVFRPEMGGGAWNDLGIYCLYPLLDLFGPPQDIFFRTHSLPTGVDGSGAALLRFPGFPAALTFSKTGQSRGVSQIMGEEGTITIQSIAQFQGIWLYDRSGAAEALAPPLQKHETMQYEARAFCDYILGRGSAVPCARASQLALQTAEWMERARQSQKYS